MGKPTGLKNEIYNLSIFSLANYAGLKKEFEFLEEYKKDKEKFKTTEINMCKYNDFRAMEVEEKLNLSERFGRSGTVLVRDDIEKLCKTYDLRLKRAKSYCGEIPKHYDTLLNQFQQLYNINLTPSDTFMLTTNEVFKNGLKEGLRVLLHHIGNGYYIVVQFWGDDITNLKKRKRDSIANRYEIHFLIIAIIYIICMIIGKDDIIVSLAMGFLVSIVYLFAGVVLGWIETDYIEK